MGCEGLEQKFPHKPNLDSIDLELQPILAIRSDIGNRKRYGMIWADNFSCYKKFYGQISFESF